MARYKLGMILLEQGRAGEAASEFQAALEAQPGFADAHFGMAKALFHEGKSEEALRQVEQSIGIDSRRKQAHFLRYQILKKLGREADAATELAKFKELRAEQQAR